jgi:uroporphyrinogen decarboxylase
MRQAGRYMAEYRKIREGRTFVEMSKTPAIAADVTLQPIRAFHMDAAILFADIMTPLEGIGIDFDIKPGIGPYLEHPIKTMDDVRALTAFEPEKSMDFLLEAIRIVVRELDGEVPLIGFAGAPFTLACYVIQGQSSKGFEEARTVMHTQPELWDALMNRLSDMVIAYLRAQVKAGAEAVQVFDSWVGQVSPFDYKHKVQPYMKRIFDGLKDVGVPRIHFGTGTNGLLELMQEAGGDVIGLDWRIDLAEGWKRVGYDHAVQGNMDPTVMLSDEETMEKHIRYILEQAGARPGHIFNVGHGIIRTTKPEHVDFMVKTVHALSRK